jgi:hypothetical protein
MAVLSGEPNVSQGLAEHFQPDHILLEAVQDRLTVFVIEVLSSNSPARTNSRCARSSAAVTEFPP